MRAIVSHPGLQHSYHLAKALYRAGMLECYVTTVCAGSRLMRLLAKIPVGAFREGIKTREFPQSCSCGGGEKGQMKEITA